MAVCNRFLKMLANLLFFLYLKEFTILRKPMWDTETHFQAAKCRAPRKKTLILLNLLWAVVGVTNLVILVFRDCIFLISVEKDASICHSGIIQFAFNFSPSNNLFFHYSVITQRLESFAMALRLFEKPCVLCSSRQNTHMENYYKR